MSISKGTIGPYVSNMEGTWEKIKVVGKGGSSTVFKGRRVPSGELIAIKEVRTDGLTEDQVRGFLAEVDTIKNLSHKNIIRYLGTEQDEGCFRIFLDYADRGSLRQFYVRNGTLRESQAANTTRQILKGLLYLHENGIAHRDVKGANVLLCSNGVMKLADFGASKRFETESVVSGLKGTPQWMAPEVIRGDQMTSGWSAADVWSVGCTVVEMMTAAVPYKDFENPMTAMYHIAKGMAPPLPEEDGQLSSSLSSSTSSGITKDVRNFVALCCAVEPSERPSADVLLKHAFILKASRKHRQKLSHSRAIDMSVALRNKGEGCVEERPGGSFYDDTAPASAYSASAAQTESDVPSAPGIPAKGSCQVASSAATPTRSNSHGGGSSGAKGGVGMRDGMSKSGMNTGDSKKQETGVILVADLEHVLKTPTPDRMRGHVVAGVLTPGSSTGPLRYPGKHMTPDISTVAESPEVVQNAALNNTLMERSGTDTASGIISIASLTNNSEGSQSPPIRSTNIAAASNELGHTIGLVSSPSPTKPAGSPASESGKPRPNFRAKKVVHRSSSPGFPPQTAAPGEPSEAPSSSSPAINVDMSRCQAQQELDRQGVSPGSFGSAARKLRMCATGDNPQANGILASPPGQISRRFFSQDGYDHEDEEVDDVQQLDNEDVHIPLDVEFENDVREMVTGKAEADLDAAAFGLDVNFDSDCRVEYQPAAAAPSPIAAPLNRPRPKAAARGTRNRSLVVEYDYDTTPLQSRATASVMSPSPLSLSSVKKEPVRDLVLLAARAAPLLPHTHSLNSPMMDTKSKDAVQVRNRFASEDMREGERPSGRRRRGDKNRLSGPAAIRQEALAALTAGEDSQCTELDNRTLVRPPAVGGTGQKLRPSVNAVRSRSAHVAGSRLPPMAGDGVSRSVTVPDGGEAKESETAVDGFLGLSGQPRRAIKTAPALSRSVNLPPLEALDPLPVVETKSATASGVQIQRQLSM